jgi:hypothetical protein
MKHYTQQIITIAQHEPDWPSDAIHPMGSSQDNPYEKFDARHQSWLAEWHTVDAHLTRPVVSIRERILARVSELGPIDIRWRLDQITQKELDKQLEKQRLEKEKEEARKDEDLMLKRATFEANWPGKPEEIEEFWVDFISSDADDKRRYERLRTKK